MRNHLLAAVAAFAVAAPATAVTVTNISVLGGNTANVVTQSAGLLETDFTVQSNTPIVLTLVTDTGDANGIAFNSIVASFFGVITGEQLLSLTLELTGATFATIGSIVPAFSTHSAVNTATTSTISFLPDGEPLGVDLGAVGGGTDNFVIAPSSERASTFLLTITPSAAFVPVPEPAAWALMIAGFGMVGSAMRRRARTTVVAA